MTVHYFVDCRKLEEVPDPGLECPKFEGVSKVELFDTDIKKCLSDAKKALSYQTGLFFYYSLFPSWGLSYLS